MIVRKEQLVATLQRIERMLVNVCDAVKKDGGMMVDDMDTPMPVRPCIYKAFQALDNQSLLDIQALSAHLSVVHQAGHGEAVPGYFMADNQIAYLDACTLQCETASNNGRQHEALHHANMYVTALCRATGIDLDDARVQYAAQQATSPGDENHLRL